MGERGCQGGRMLLAPTAAFGQNCCIHTGKREIWRGITDDHGATWKWEPATANSTQDNFRPVILKWKPDKEALLWFRGTYTTAQTFSTNFVGTFYDYEPSVAKRENRNRSMNTTSCFSAYDCRTVNTYSFQSPPLAARSGYSLAGRQIATLLDKNQCRHPFALF